MPLDQDRTRHALVKARVPSDPGRLRIGRTPPHDGVDRHDERNRSCVSGPSTLFHEPPRTGLVRVPDSPRSAIPPQPGLTMCCLPAGTDASSQSCAADLLSRVTRRNTPFPGSGALAPPTAAAAWRFRPGGVPAFHAAPAAAALDGHCWQLQPWMAGQLALRRPTEARSPPPEGCPVSRARAYAGVLDLT